MVGKPRSGARNIVAWLYVRYVVSFGDDLSATGIPEGKFLMLFFFKKKQCAGKTMFFNCAMACSRNTSFDEFAI